MKDYKKPPLEKLLEWREKAKEKNAIVPEYFEVFPNKVILVCGGCGHKFIRMLIPNLNEPTFVCPNEKCKIRNWVPVRYKLSY